MGINFFTFNGKSSTDFNAFISGENTWETPNKDMEIISVPGRNGTLSISNKRYNNIEIPYKTFIIQDFDKNYSALKAYLFSTEGYCRLEDTYHPEHFRKARYNSTLSPEMTQLNRHGEFEVIFDCDPRRFLKVTSEPITITSGMTYKNKTLFTANPVIRAYGTGTITVNGVSVTVTTANVYTDLDSEIQEAYKGTTNCNANITLTDGEFPTLAPGDNAITFSGFSSVELTANLWTI